MLQRDAYHEDSIQKYFPNFSLEKYFEHINPLGKDYYKLILNTQQSERWNSRMSFVNNAVTIAFTIGLIPVILYKKTPGLKKFTSKKARILWSLGILFIPTNLVNYYFTSKLQQQVNQSYNVNLLDFMKYRLTGDATVMNSQLEFTEF